MTAINYATDHGVARIMFNRPERKNSFTLEMFENFAELIERAQHDPEERQDQHVEDVGIPDAEGEQDEDEKRRTGNSLLRHGQARPFPRIPRGKKIRTRTKMMKPNASL